MGKYSDEYLKIMKGYENLKKIGNVVGEVIEGFPNIRISILSSNVVLYPEMLYFCESILKGYKREFEEQGDIEFSDSNCGETNSVNDGGDHASSHKHTVQTINISTTYHQKGIITMTDTLKVGDKVMLCPSDQEDKWFVVDKVKQVI